MGIDRLHTNTPFWIGNVPLIIIIIIIIIIITFIGRLIRAFLSAQVVCLTEYHLFTHVYNFIQ